MNRWPTKLLGDVLAQRLEEYRIQDPSKETFVTVRLYGKGAVQRQISDGKTPKLKVGYRLKTSDLVYSRIDARNGAFALVPANLAGAVVSKDFPSFAVLRARINPSFLCRFLGTQQFFRQLQASSFGTTNRQRISEQMFLSYRIPVPPLAEQERIVKLLDEADELRRLRTQADYRTASLIPAFFYHMFGNGKLRCPTMTLENAVERFIDYRGKTPEKTAVGIPLVTAKIVKGGRILPANEFISEELYGTWMSRGLPKVGDVLFTTEAPLGEVAMVKDTRIALAQRILLMRPKADLFDSQYFMIALKMPYVWRQIEERATGSTVLGIRQAELRQVQIPVPPMPLQRTFAQRVTAIRALEIEQATSRTGLDALFQSMLHRAFNGEV